MDDEPRLVEGNVMLRRLVLKDAPEALAAVRESAALLGIWLADLTSVTSTDEIRAWIEEGRAAWTADQAYDFAIVDVHDSLLVGGCGLSRIHPRHRFANLYYWVRASRSGAGVATTATRLIARWGLLERKLNRIEIVVACGNAASLRVAEKAGATREAVLRRRLVLPDGATDAVMFSFVAPDFDPG